METADGRERARTYVHDEMTRRGWSNADLARAAEIDAGTVGDFLGGTRWPKGGTQSRIARAFGWEPERLNRVARGEGVAEGRTEFSATASGSVSDRQQDEGVLLSMPPDALEGLSPAEREEVVTAAKLSALEKAREIRRRLDG